MSHYFSEKQEVKSDKKIIKYTIENKNFLYFSGILSQYFFNQNRVITIFCFKIML